MSMAKEVANYSTPTRQSYYIRLYTMVSSSLINFMLCLGWRSELKYLKVEPLIANLVMKP